MVENQYKVIIRRLRKGEYETNIHGDSLDYHQRWFYNGQPIHIIHWPIHNIGSDSFQDALRKFPGLSQIEVIIKVQGDSEIKFHTD